MKDTFTTLLLGLFVSLITYGQIEKIEPPFWWSGMHTEQLQLLCYGKEIAKYDIEIDGITVHEIKKTENVNYVFITIDTKDISPGTFSIEFKENDTSVFSQPYEFKTRREDSAERKGLMILIKIL